MTSGYSREVSPSRAQGKVAEAGARRGRQTPPSRAPRPGPGRKGARSGFTESSPSGSASALTSGKKLSIVPVRSPTCRSRASSSRKSAQQKVRGNHACQGATRRNSSPRGSPAAIALSSSRLSHLLFAQTQFSNSSVPNAAFVSSSSKFFTSGRSARERRTAGGTFFPRARGEWRGIWECAPSL